MAITEQTPLERDFLPDYHLSAEQLKLIEQQMVEDARAIAPDSVVVSWVDPTHEYSNFLRTKEAENFPEVAETDMYYELNQVYLVIVDTREEGSVAHAATINFYDDSADTDDTQGSAQRTGFYTIDSLIEHGNFTKQEFIEYYSAQGIDPCTTISIETNFKINPDMPLYKDLGSADLAYLGIFQWLMHQGWNPDTVTLLATINEKQTQSLERVGIKTSLLMNRSDFLTEEEELGKYSLPVTIDFKTGCEIISAADFRLSEITYGPSTDN